jgi:hypothetical protein
LALFSPIWEGYRSHEPTRKSARLRESNFPRTTHLNIILCGDFAPPSFQPRIKRLSMTYRNH